MQIRVPTGNCRAAVSSAIEAIVVKIRSDRDKLFESSFEALKGGAAHNGLIVDAAREQEMREMTARDVDHMMSQHPAKETLDVLNNFSYMLAFHQADDVVIDDQDFHLLKAYLDPRKEDPALAAKDDYHGDKQAGVASVDSRFVGSNSGRFVQPPSDANFA